MWYTPMLVFGCALLGIVFLFVLKSIETKRSVRYANFVRSKADQGALEVKRWMEITEWYLERTPWFLNALARYGIHIGALSFARLARTSAEQAHRLADFVSHKHRFERRETKSKYLKDVSEFKNSDDGVVK